MTHLVSQGLPIEQRDDATDAPLRVTQRRRLLEDLLGAVGEGAEIRPPFSVDYGSQITIGARTFANYGLIALDGAAIIIGEDVQIGPNVQLLTATHPLEPGLRRHKWEAAEPITIGDNAWLGGGTIVCRESRSARTPSWAPAPSSHEICRRTC